MSDQNIIGLEAAYKAVYGIALVERVRWLVDEYGARIDATCCELNPGNTVPCHWTLSELAEHYRLI